jgi:hypothetical protein
VHGSLKQSDAKGLNLNRPAALVFDLDGEVGGILECGRVALHLKGCLRVGDCNPS